MVFPYTVGLYDTTVHIKKHIKRHSGSCIKAVRFLYWKREIERERERERERSVYRQGETIIDYNNNFYLYEIPSSSYIFQTKLVEIVGFFIG